jgi:hypothetical protein
VIRLFKQWRAHRRLNRLVRKQLQSFEVRDYAKRRKAALKHVPKVWAS